MPLADYPRLEKAHILLDRAAGLLAREYQMAFTEEGGVAIGRALDKATGARDWVELAADREDTE